MKKILFVLMIAVFITGCSKNENEIDEYENLTESQKEIYNLLKEYKLLNKFEELDNIFTWNNNDSIWFVGKLKDLPKIGLNIFNSKTKEELINIIPFENNEITIERSYGEKVTLTLKYLTPYNYIQNGETLIIPLYAEGNGVSIMRFLFVNNNKIINYADIPDYYYNSPYFPVYNWGKNVVLPTYVKKENIYTLYPLYLYNLSGEKILEIIYTRARFLGVSSGESTYLISLLNDYEGIICSGGSLSRIDLRQIEDIWSTIIVPINLDQPRFDKKELIGKTNTHFTYEISYTEISGVKGKFRVKVNIETGEIEYL